MEVRRGLTTETVMNQRSQAWTRRPLASEVQSTSDAPRDRQDKNTRTATRAPSIIVGIVAAVVAALSVFYLLRPEPLLVQGEADATRLDISRACRRTGQGNTLSNVARTLCGQLSSYGSTIPKLSPNTSK